MTTEIRPKRGIYPDGVTREDFLAAIAKFDQGVRQGFADSIDYDILMPDGRRYPPKAIAGIAATRAAGRELKPIDFSAGEGQKCFTALREQGFKIVRKEGVEELASQYRGWDDRELMAAVDAYLKMLSLVNSGARYSKAALRTMLPSIAMVGRTQHMVELGMQHVSAALAEVGHKWIPEYEPRVPADPGAMDRIFESLAEISPPDFLQFVPTEDKEEAAKRANAILNGPQIGKPSGNQTPKSVDRVTKHYERSTMVQAFVRQEAAGVCELCRNPAPFFHVAGLPFLEVHHVVGLAEGGPDTVENAAALCPNCHRLLHHSADRTQARTKLYGQVSRLRQLS